jgi:hypothetical protein
VVSVFRSLCGHFGFNAGQFKGVKVMEDSHLFVFSSSFQVPEPTASRVDGI